MSELIYDNVLCCLDLTQTDTKILKFAHLLKASGVVKNMKFIHVISNELEEKAREYTDNETWNAYKHGIRADIENQLKSKFDNDDNVEVFVKGGSALEVINTQSKSEEMDLVIVGKKNTSKGSGISARHVARSSSGDVVFIPEDWDEKLESALMAYDFSEHAEKTLKEAFTIASEFKIKDFNVLNVLSSPSGFFKAGRVHRDFVDAEKTASNKKWEKECENHPEYDRIDFTVLENERNDIAHYIQITADKEASPLIFVGSKGKSASSAFLLGSVTEKLLLSDLNRPLWIHKIKGENLDLFDAIFRGD